MDISRNHAEVLGEVTTEPTEHTTKNDKVVSRFTLTTSSENGGETYKQHHSITVWGEDAKWVIDEIRLGDWVFVEGAMRTRSYLSQEGAKRYSFEIVAKPRKFGGIMLISESN